jgi:hypothetical protein
MRKRKIAAELVAVYVIKIERIHVLSRAKEREMIGEAVIIFCGFLPSVLSQISWHEQ